MAYKPQLNDVLEVRTITFDPSPPVQVGVNVTHFAVFSVAAGGATQQEIAAAIDNAVAATYKTAIANNVNYRGTMVQKMWPLPRVASEFSIANAAAGSGGANQTPTQVSGLIKTFTANAGRAFRGRIFIPFLAQNQIGADGNATFGLTAIFTAIGAALFVNFTVVGATGTTVLNPVIWHNKGYGKPLANAKTVTLITGSAGSPLLATQKRRGNYGRINASSPI